MGKIHASRTVGVGAKSSAEGGGTEQALVQAFTASTDRLPVVIPAILDAFHPMSAAGVVDQYIHPAGDGPSPVGELIDARGAGDVHLVNVRRGRAALEALGGDLPEAILPARAQQQIRTHRSELPSRLSAEPARGSTTGRARGCSRWRRWWLGVTPSSDHGIGLS